MNSSQSRRAQNASTQSNNSIHSAQHARSESSSHPHTTYESFADLIPTSPPPGSPPRRGWMASSPILGTFNRSRRSGWRGSLGGESVESGGAEGERADHYGHGGGDGEGDEEEGALAKRLSTWQLILLTVGLAGAQLTWTVEMAFGTPYLLTLGLSKQSTSLVWLAGPLSGLIAQPVVGALSDSSTSRFRRRQFILGSGGLIIASTLFVAYAKELAGVLASLSGLGDWDPDQKGKTDSLAIAIGVVGFYVLDFSLNGLQASLRALTLDQAPTAQQNEANAWHGRMTHVANIVGYTAGYLDLGHSPAMRWIGGGQFRKLAVLSCAVMALCVGTTCYTQKEKPRPKREGDNSGQIMQAFRNVKDNVKNLPVAVRRVCLVQLFAWTAWFPFLFYSTTYVAETLYASIPPGQTPPSSDTATRYGSRALLYYAIVSLISGITLPLLTRVGETSFVRRRVSRTSRLGRAVRHALALLSLRNFWTVGMAWYAAGMVATFWVSSVEGAMVLVAWSGVSWAIACWVPFALVMEAIREIPSPAPTPGLEEGARTPVGGAGEGPKPVAGGGQAQQPFRSGLSRAGSYNFPAVRNGSGGGGGDERTSLLTHSRGGSNYSGYPSRPQLATRPSQLAKRAAPASGGTILGIHNLAVVAPQFLVALIAAAIFEIAGKAKEGGGAGEVRAWWAGTGGGGDDDGGLRGSNDVVWVLRFGGLAALAGVVASRWVLSPESEEDYRYELLREDDGEDDE